MFFLEDLPSAQTLKGFAARFPEMEIDTTAACLRLLRVASHLLRDLETYFASHGLSQARFLVLVVIERSPDKRLMPVEIAKQLGISKKNTARVLTFMEEDGLVHRTSHESDGRASIVAATAKGAKLLADTMPGYYRVFNQTLKPLDVKTKKMLIGILDQIGPSLPRRACCPTPQ
jgi:DNA-binding MarR family transcriptional regulator